jgi:hypothetical protein
MALQINPDYDVFWRGVSNLWFAKETGLDLGFGVPSRVTSSAVLALDSSPEHVAQIILSRWLRFHALREPTPQLALLQRVARWYGGMAMCAYAGDCVGWDGAKKWTKVLTNEAAAMLSGYSDSTDPELRQAWKGEDLREAEMPAEELIRRVKAITGLDLALVDVPNTLTTSIKWSEWISETPAAPAAPDAHDAPLSPLSSFCPPPIGMHKPAYCTILIPERYSHSHPSPPLRVFQLGGGGIFVFDAPPTPSIPWWERNSSPALLRGAAIAAEQGGLRRRAAIANVFPVDPDVVPGDEAAEALPEQAPTSVEVNVDSEFVLSLILSPSSGARDELWSRMCTYTLCPKLRMALGLVSDQGVAREQSHLDTYRGKDGTVESDSFPSRVYSLTVPHAEVSILNELASRCKLGLWIPTPNLMVGFAGDRLGYAARLLRGHLTRGQKIGGSHEQSTPWSPPFKPV